MMRSAVPRPSAARSVKIKVFPPPTAFAERRAILHALKQRADIALFKQMADDAAFQVQTNDPVDAASLVESSPLELEYHADTHDDSFGGLLPRPPPRPDGKTNTKKVFKISINASAYPHLRAIRENPLYGPWPDERSPFDAGKFRHDSLALNALQLAVPNNMAVKGLRDWETSQDPHPDAYNPAGSHPSGNRKQKRTRNPTKGHRGRKDGKNSDLELLEESLSQNAI
ncbi:hypothetical protein B0T16DRAFT_177014 [Cercophora newfieldiana]|uniref:Uncharacterized protein n=1 Tax=Cercophora newfieldiana TaxID=92897 RepID=A0AA39Y0E8_9PEZI|nr:hypothetical protein B0T16DRAFT_177014 [Cercophora newfieldiana]